MGNRGGGTCWVGKFLTFANGRAIFRLLVAVGLQDLRDPQGDDVFQTELVRFEGLVDLFLGFNRA
jgi:hypothetical protein